MRAKSSYEKRIFSLVVTTTLFAILLSILPSRWAHIYWPDWTLLTVIYWCLAIPSKVNIRYAWATGILADLLQSSLLGYHALFYTAAAYIASSFHQRIRLYPPHQQVIPIFLMLLLCKIIEIWINGMVYSFMTPRWEDMIPVLTGMLAWPWIFAMLRHLRQKIYLTEQG